MFALKGVRHEYGGQTVVNVPQLEVPQGDHCLLMGRSGSGKTTLLHILAGLLAPTEGRVQIGEQPLHALHGSALDRFRGRTIGIVFQQLHLLATLSVLENLLLAQHLAGLGSDSDSARAALKDLNIADLVGAYPHQLSFGQRQRVAIARAVINRPQLILGDEPTSSLDDYHAGQVVDLLIQQAERYNATLFIATHDQRITKRFSNQYRLGPI